MSSDNDPGGMPLWQRLLADAETAESCADPMIALTITLAAMEEKTRGQVEADRDAARMAARFLASAAINNATIRAYLADLLERCRQEFFKAVLAFLNEFEVEDKPPMS